MYFNRVDILNKNAYFIRNLTTAILAKLLYIQQYYDIVLKNIYKSYLNTANSTTEKKISSAPPCPNKWSKNSYIINYVHLELQRNLTKNQSHCPSSHT